MGLYNERTVSELRECWSSKTRVVDGIFSVFALFVMKIVAVAVVVFVKESFGLQ